jgi:pimeloyl-ACP methyl ester carboxylesterase
VQPEHFRVSIPDSTLTDLRERLARTRWPDRIPGSQWDYGTDTDYLKELVQYWRTGFDWRATERRINAFENYRAVVDGVGIHFIRVKGRGPNPIPVLIAHGWPSSFLQMLDIVPLLTDPEAHGAPGAPSFDVVIPSLIGYGFSDIPAERGLSELRMADYFAKLMSEVLGYERYALRGSDVGAEVMIAIARKHPEKVIGLHLTGVRPIVFEAPPGLTPAEERFVESVRRWMETERAYAMMHVTRPQTVAHALNDSPAGLAAWIVEKFRLWSDCAGDVARRFTMDELLGNLTVYWTTGTINSSIRLYYESARDLPPPLRPDVPTAFLMAEHDLVDPPREWLARSGRIDRWNKTPVGGHFLEWEEPELVASDMRAFFSGKTA